jgi:hypothetical protein
MRTMRARRSTGADPSLRTTSRVISHSSWGKANAGLVLSWPRVGRRHILDLESVRLNSGKMENQSNRFIHSQENCSIFYRLFQAEVCPVYTPFDVVESQVVPPHCLEKSCHSIRVRWKGNYTLALRLAYSSRLVFRAWCCFCFVVIMLILRTPELVRIISKVGGR